MSAKQPSTFNIDCDKFKKLTIIVDFQSSYDAVIGDIVGEHMIEQMMEDLEERKQELIQGGEHAEYVSTYVDNYVTVQRVNDVICAVFQFDDTDDEYVYISIMTT